MSYTVKATQEILFDRKVNFIAGEKYEGENRFGDLWVKGENHWCQVAFDVGTNWFTWRDEYEGKMELQKSQ